MKITVFLAALIVVSFAFPLREKEFQQWKEEYHKIYVNSNEHDLRLKIFSSNLAYIEQYNSNAKQPSDVRLGMNQFGDLTNSEYRTMMLSHRIPLASKATAVHETVGTRPDSIDWRDHNIVTPVKNQGSCGSCWAFSTVGGMEGAWAKHTGNLVSFSEQQLVDCSTSFGNEGCNGGLMSQAMDYILQYGAMTEEKYPYKARNGKCAYDSSDIYTFTKYVNITEASEEELQDALGNVSPVAVAIDASHLSFQFYRSGVYDEKKCKNKEDELDHGVLAVGYGTDNGKDYYIVKNSWGASWGQKGYIWMSRNKDNQCGIATAAEYPIFD